MKKLTNEGFIKKAKNFHGDKYNYSLVNYVNSRTKVKIICKKHGEFKQLAASHLMGSGCPKCFKKERLDNVKFIFKSKKIHRDKYNYSLVNYVNSRTKVKIICPKHGEFEVLPRNHYNNGSKCPKCRNEDLSNRFSFNTEEFIKKAKKIHGNKYNYSLVEYVNANKKIKIVCPQHGEFKQTPSNHMGGYGCFKCAKVKIGKLFSLTKEEFIEKAKRIHGNRYKYFLVDYVNHGTKVKIVCSKHGIFEQAPNSHLANQGCPICRESKGEKKIREYLVKKGISFKRQKKFDNCKNKLKLPFDFYVPNKNLLIEYDGKQHFKPIKFFGGKNGFLERQQNDKIKNNFVKTSNFNLLRIPYYEYNNIETILNNNL